MYNFENNYTATKKGQELFRRSLYRYVFWDAESEFEAKLALYPISFGDNLKKKKKFISSKLVENIEITLVILLKIS